MHIAQIGFFVDVQQRTPVQLLSEWRALVDIARAAATAVDRVSVIQASTIPATIQESTVTYYFVRPDPETGRLTGSREFQALLDRLTPDVIHVHGLGFADGVRELASLAPGTGIYLQDHANRPPRYWHRKHWKSAFNAVSAVSFCAHSQAEPFRRAGLLHDSLEVFEVPESTSRFQPGDQDAARRITGVHGTPALLWVGNLDRNKDPLTVLDGISLLHSELPDLRLWCCFSAAPLRKSVERKLSKLSSLQQRVHLLGRVSHDEIENYMRAADLFVLGSHREGCNFSTLEALATGLTPVVTDIPSMQSLTENGTVGQLWQHGSSRSLSESLLKANEKLGSETKSRVREFFDSRLSSAALGTRLNSIYRKVAKMPPAPRDADLRLLEERTP
jgi:glycosyltransferase involved in cell wall biosynthesis